MTKHQRYCINKTCHSTENLIKTAYNKKLDKQSYMCSPCNTLRARAYRATPQGMKNVRAAIVRSEKKHAGKQEARVALNNAIRRGEIVKPKKCVIADCTGTKLQAHHPSYRNAKFVLFLCNPHHREAHKPLNVTVN